MSGAGAAAPLARDAMVEVFNRLRPAPGQRVAEAGR
jgi:penicillin-binding protein 2